MHKAVQRRGIDGAARRPVFIDKQIQHHLFLLAGIIGHPICIEVQGLALILFQVEAALFLQLVIPLISLVELAGNHDLLAAQRLGIGFISQALDKFQPILDRKSVV